MNEYTVERDTSTGAECWRKEGYIHREDGPAIIHDNGSMSWFKSGMRHREDGPAIVWNTPTTKKEQCYYLYDIELSEEFYNKITKGPVEDLPKYLGQGFDELIARRLSS